MVSRSGLTLCRFFSSFRAGSSHLWSWGWDKAATIKASKFTEAQIASVLKQPEADAPVGEVCGKAEISDAAFYTWSKRCGDLMPSELKRLRHREEENAKLKGRSVSKGRLEPPK